MSGGSYDYAYRTVEDAADAMRRRHRDKPHVVAFSRLMDRVAAVMRDIEWADSLDTVWDDELDASIRAVLSTGESLTVATEYAKDALAKLAAEIAAAAPAPGPGIQPGNVPKVNPRGEQP